MFIVAFLSVVVADQLSKLLAKSDQVIINSGVSFAWLSGLRDEVITGIVIVLAVLLALALRNNWARFPLWSGIFWGGVVSNIIDRLIFGGVSDWLLLPGIEYRNNLADIAIGIGMVGLAINWIYKRYGARIRNLI